MPQLTHLPDAFTLTRGTLKTYTFIAVFIYQYDHA